MNKTQLIEIGFTILLAFAVITGGVFTASKLSNHPVAQDASLGGSFSIDSRSYITGGSGTSVQVGEPAASTTVAFLTTANTATSSITAYAGTSDAFEMNLLGTASSSSSNLQYWIYYSDNKIDWYAEDGVLQTVGGAGRFDHASTTIAHNWTPGVTTRTGKHVVIPVSIGKYVKVDFGVTGANMSLYGYVAPRAYVPN